MEEMLLAILGIETVICCIYLIITYWYIVIPAYFIPYPVQRIFQMVIGFAFCRFMQLCQRTQCAESQKLEQYFLNVFTRPDYCGIKVLFGAQLFQSISWAFYLSFAALLLNDGVALWG